MKLTNFVGQQKILEKNIIDVVSCFPYTGPVWNNLFLVYAK
jgi:hypothetical protein